MILHEDDISAHETVYSLIHGIGVVSRLDETRQIIYVRFSNVSATAEFAYDSNGIESDTSKATLYWHNPLVINPPKNYERWTKLKSTLEKFYEAILSL